MGISVNMQGKGTPPATSFRTDGDAIPFRTLWDSYLTQNEAPRESDSTAIPRATQGAA
jgi:hypothetical protein